MSKCNSSRQVSETNKSKINIFLGDEAKKKWRNLRDQFSKELKKIPKTKSGDSQDSVPKYPGKWQYFNMLLFLRDILTPRATEGNVSEDTRSSEVNQENSDEDESVNLPVSDVDEETINTNTDTPNFQSTTQVIPQVAETFSEPSISARPPKRQMGSTTTLLDSVPARPSRKRRNVHTNETNMEKELLNIETKKLAILERSEDDDMMFFRSLLPYFRKMQPIQKLRVRNKFQDIVIQELSTPSHDSEIYFPHSNSSSASTHCATSATTSEYITSPSYSYQRNSPSNEDSTAQYLTNFYPS